MTTTNYWGFPSVTGDLEVLSDLAEEMALCYTPEHTEEDSTVQEPTVKQPLLQTTE